MGLISLTEAMRVKMQAAVQDQFLKDDEPTADFEDVHRPHKDLVLATEVNNTDPTVQKAPELFGVNIYLFYMTAGLIVLIILILFAICCGCLTRSNDSAEKSEARPVARKQEQPQLADRTAGGVKRAATRGIAGR